MITALLAMTRNLSQFFRDVTYLNLRANYLSQGRTKKELDEAVKQRAQWMRSETPSTEDN